MSDTMECASLLHLSIYENGFGQGCFQVEDQCSLGLNVDDCLFLFLFFWRVFDKTFLLGEVFYFRKKSLCKTTGGVLKKQL